MAGYKPVKIAGMKTGLVQEREEFLLPDDAYPVLQNAYVWRERIKRKQGVKKLGRLQRNFTTMNWFVTGASIWSFTIKTEKGYIVNANNANPGQITTKYAHNLTTGDQIIITGIAGAIGYNNVQFTVTVIDSTNFTIGADATAFGAYTVPIEGEYNGTFVSNRNSTETNSQIVPGSVVFTIAAGTPIVLTDQGDGTLTSPTAGNSATINYFTGELFITHTAGATVATTIAFDYYPSLPVMGVLSRELNSENNEETIFFDTKYAYHYLSGISEFIPGTTWTGTNYNFFWGTNYWVTPAPDNNKLFWVTNFSGTSGDPIRYTDGSVWIDFAPTINTAGDKLNQCLAMVPFRGRMVAFRTLEGATLASSIQYFQRIRWAAIGNPISDTSSLFPVGSVNTDAWKDDIRGQGGFLDIPTSQAIMAIGFVRDNLVIYCERSTWQLRYTGRSIAPFQVERVNAELGAESTFSAVQFDTSLVGIGDKGIVQCDSFKSDRIDIKIPDLVFDFHNIENGNKRVYGIRDFQKRLAYWIYPYGQNTSDDIVFPNRRLVYNYENDSWAIFIDNFTALGNFQNLTSLTWAEATFSWQSANFPWIGKPALFPDIAAGNQQGYILILDQLVTNQNSQFISNITGNSPNVTVITSPDHNLQTGQVIQISGILGTDPFLDLNSGIYGIQRVDANNFQIYEYDSTTGDFSTPQVHASGTYLGNAEYSIRDNFIIQSKKFNFLDSGENIQLGYIDILMDNTDSGEITMNVYADYNTANPTNTKPNNEIPATGESDSFFNQSIPTYISNPTGSTKNWQRVFCPTRAAFLTIEFTLSNSQLNSSSQEQDVQIDAQIMWVRSAGKQLPVGV